MWMYVDAWMVDVDAWMDGLIIDVGGRMDGGVHGSKSPKKINIDCERDGTHSPIATTYIHIHTTNILVQEHGQKKLNEKYRSKNTDAPYILQHTGCIHTYTRKYVHHAYGN